MLDPAQFDTILESATKPGSRVIGFKGDTFVRLVDLLNILGKFTVPKCHVTEVEDKEDPLYYKVDCKYDPPLTQEQELAVLEAELDQHVHELVVLDARLT